MLCIYKTNPTELKKLNNKRNTHVKVGRVFCVGKDYSEYSVPQWGRSAVEQLVGLYGFMLLCIWNGRAIQTNVIYRNITVIIWTSAFPEPLLQPL